MAVREDKEAATRAELAAIGRQAIVEPSDMEKCLTSLNVVEGSASPPRPPTPPITTDIISYDDSLRVARQSKPSPCEELTPLKGILKSGGARDDHQKVVCFSGPVVDKEQEEKEKHPIYPPGKQPHFNEEEDFCARYRDPDAKERAERRARDECAYDVVPPPEAGSISSMLDNEQEKPKLPGYLGTYEVDCKEVPDYMRLAPDAYDKIKHMRRDVPDISPAATRVAQYPRLPPTDVDTCVHPPEEETGPCAPYKEEDVAFSCEHVEPKLPCCVPKTGNE